MLVFSAASDILKAVLKENEKGKLSSMYKNEDNFLGFLFAFYILKPF